METKVYNCPVEAAIDVIGGKWKPLILWWLHHRTHRFAELRRLMPGIYKRCSRNNYASWRQTASCTAVLIRLYLPKWSTR